MTGVSTFATLRPTNTSASMIASESVCRSRAVANSLFCTFISCRSSRITPFESHMTRFSRFTPSLIYNLAQLIAADPAPFITSFISSRRFFCTSTALIKAAPEIIAVPCWSSCMTGISHSFLRRSSILKHSGALMSSRLIPPNVGLIAFTISTSLSGSFSSISMSKESIPAKILKRSDFPSITGFPAKAPISPRPRTAVPLEMTAT